MSRRGRNEGTIYRRAKGKFRAQVTLGGHRMSFTGSTRAECQLWLRKMHDQIDRGLTAKGIRITVAEFMAFYLETASTALRPNIGIQYAGITRNHVLPEIGHMRLMDLRTEHIDRLYQNRLKAGVSNRMVRFVHAILHRALRKAVEMGYLARNPVDGSTPPRLIEKEMLVLNEEQAYQFLVVAHNSRQYALYLLALKTGMRQAEILGLRWDDLNWRTGILQVKRQLQRVSGRSFQVSEPKTKSGRRVIQLGAGTLASLRDHQLAQNAQRHALGEGWVDQGWIFPSSIGTPLDLRNLLRDFKEVLKLGGLPEIRFHDLRHTAASIMLQRNVPVFTVSKILGHAKPSTTLDIYGHLIPGALGLAAQAMEDALTPVAMPINPESTPATRKSGAEEVQI